MKKLKKQILYQLDPRYFKDYTNNGIGDLKGLAAKVDYFEYLGVNSILLQNFLALDAKEKTPNFKSIAKEIGTTNDLITVISLLKTKKIDLYIEMPIGSIKKNHVWFKNSLDDKTNEFTNIIDFKSNVDELNKDNYKYSKVKKAYYQIDDKTKEIPLNWTSDAVINKFADVIRFWKDLGVKGFVFTGFEYIANENKDEIMSEDTLKELRKFYNTIKEIDYDIAVIGKSQFIFNNTYTKGTSKIFDYFITEKISLLGTHKKAGNDLIGRFSPRKLAKMISEYATSPEHIISFGSNKTGRINSRWGNTNQWSSELSKALLMLLMFNPSSSAIYYGDEIGAKNIGLTRLDDFQDPDLEVRKEALLKSMAKDDQFMDAQILQNPINSRSLMAWDDSKNGGFSNSEKTITPVSTTYKDINVKNQFLDKSSSLSFAKELIRIVLKSSYKNIIQHGEFKVSSLIPGVIRLNFKLDTKELRVYVNLTDKVRPIKKAKIGKVVLSNKFHKIYKELPNRLDAYEAILISKQTDEAFKETIQIKLHKQKELEKTKELELKEIKNLEKLKLKEELEKQKAKEKEELEKINLEAEKLREKERKEKEVQKQKELKQKEKEKKERELEKTRQIELKEKQKEEKRLQKEKERKARELERTREIELKEKEKEVRRLQKEKEKEARELERKKELELKEKAKIEKQFEKQEIQAEKELNHEINHDDINNIFIDDQTKDLNNEEIIKENDIEINQEEIIDQNDISINKEKISTMSDEAKKLEKQQNHIHPDERTQLTEKEIAKTTQLTESEIDDFEIFLTGEEKNNKK